MKKFTLFAASLLCIAGQIVTAEELSLTRGWNCSLQQQETTEVPQYPARVDIGGQWQNIKLCDQSFDATVWNRYKITLAEPVASEGIIQVMVRNAAEAQNYSGAYLPISGGVTEVEGTFEGIAFTDDDPVVTVLGLQNMSSEAVSVVLNDVVLYNVDGSEWHTTLANDWGGTVTKLTEGGETISTYSFGQWGTLVHNFDANIVPEEGDVHRFVVTSSEPFPANFQWKVIRGSNDGDAIYPGVFVEGETTAVLELTSENIRKSADDAIDYYTGVAIQYTSSTAATLPTDVKMEREVRYANGAIERTTLPVKVSYGAELRDPNPSLEVGENGLPCQVNLPGSWGAIMIWLENFNVAEYPAYKIVLGSKPADGSIQMFYRNETHGSSGGVYVPWATSDEMLSELSEDGLTLTGEFDIDVLDGDNDILAFCLQNTTSSAVSFVLNAVYLINEDGEEIPTAGLSSAGIWNGGSTMPIGGSYDADGNLFDAYVDFTQNYGSIGTYSGTVAEGTYHRYTISTEEPLANEIIPVCYNGSPWYEMFGWGSPMENVAFNVSGRGTNDLVIEIPASYETLQLQLWLPEDNNVEFPYTIRVTKVLFEVIEGELEIKEPTSINATEEGHVVSVEYYNAAGVRVAKPAGVVIVHEMMNNGTVRTRKVMK